MRNPYGGAPRKGPTTSGKTDSSYGKSFRATMGSMFGGVASGIANAAVVGITTWVGFKSGGALGAAGGLAIGSAVAEPVKAATSSWFDFRNAKRAEREAAAAGGGSSGGSSISAGSGGGSGIQQVKQTAAAIASRITEGDGALAAAVDKLSSASTLVEAATQDSTSATVQQLKANMARALEAADEAMKIAAPSRQGVTEWVGKI